MSQTAPPSDKNAKPAANKLVPPDERFWQRYSPHAELPLSSAGSFVVHILFFGLLILASFLGTLFFNSNRSLPVEAVQLSGGGGNPKGVGEGPNTGDVPQEAAPPSNDKPATTTVPNEDVPPPDLKINPATPPKPKFNEPGRQITMDESNKTLQNLRLRAGTIPTPGSSSSSSPGYGKGGRGSGGGSGDGKGPGVGNASGPGVGTPTQREKRMLRWSMLFNTSNSSDYVAQLRGLGAILAIPVREDAAKGICDYKILRDLSTSHPAKFSDEDIHNIQRLVRWVDENPESVRGVMAVLRLNLKPSHFLAFMPEELEEKLLRLEIDYLKRNHRGHKEDDIKATKFRIKVRTGKYEPEVTKQELD
jgi:hypothetical protein